MSYQLAFSSKLFASNGNADLSDTEVAEIAEHNIVVQDEESGEKAHSQATKTPIDETWALVEHIILDAIAAMEDAVQYVNQGSKRLILFSLKRSYRRVRAIRDRRGLYPVKDARDIQDLIDLQIILKKYA